MHIGFKEALTIKFSPSASFPYFAIMKSTALIVSFLLVTLTTHSQIEIHQDGFDPGTYIGVDSSGGNISELHAKFYIVNNGASAVDVEVRRKRYVHPTAWSDYFGFHLLTFIPSGDDWTTPISENIAVGDSIYLGPDVFTDSTLDCAKYTYYAINAGTSQIEDSIMVDFINVVGNCFLETSTEEIILDVYPNPTLNGSFTIVHGLNQGTYRILSVDGSECAIGSLTSGQTTVDLNHLKNGIYILEILEDGGRSKTLRILKN